MSQIEGVAPLVSSPMADYSIKGLGKGGEVAAIIVGTLAVLAISFGFGKIFKKKA